MVVDIYSYSKIITYSSHVLVGYLAKVYTVLYIYFLVLFKLFNSYVFLEYSNRVILYWM